MHKHLLKASKVIATALERKDEVRIYIEKNGKIIGNKNALLALYETSGMREYKQVGFSHISFHIVNFEEIEQKCNELGIEIKFNGPVQWPNSRSIYIDDPNGYEIELVEVWGGGLV